ncbi:fructose-bisphosphate aldolase-lysine N-methyltransferase, chloroplastic [Selaginella moellendorffii]|uniref:fructose-bisphosphate aldolase-lysine N-methyltransferase, chloroplastic n=1 Tax=Selaginella moellendorffii TaxID=88036 RepID=UPI000D1CF902|nr:fructose-bisphosphate aldolase-lysine N-methyltransferase, chloroplastic [Selaginella moellendorffii]|eukprot:XP_024523975.1 fructose-bisphosphate aldolase-lysine N-methyltransferase, chloroplastic [Selaginella moellendorffii]
MVQHQLISEACCVPVFIPQFPYIACRPAWTDSSNHLSVALRNAHMLSENGELYTWGKNRDYQLGIPGLKDEQLDPVPLQFPQALHDKTPVEVLATLSHDVAIHEEKCGRLPRTLLLPGAAGSISRRSCALQNQAPRKLSNGYAGFMSWVASRNDDGDLSAVRIGTWRQSGRGLFASRPVRAGERVLEISLDLMIAPTRLPDQLSTVLPSTVKPWTIVLMERYKGQLQSSAWAPYISCLPEPAELDNTFLWEDTELSYLRASPLYGKTRERLEIITTEFGQVQNALDVWPQLFGKVSVEDFMHVYATVFSRPLAIGEDSTLVMIPMLDFFNHNAASFAKLSFNGLLNYAVRTETVLKTIRFG